MERLLFVANFKRTALLLWRSIPFPTLVLASRWFLTLDGSPCGRWACAEEMPSASCRRRAAKGGAGLCRQLLPRLNICSLGCTVFEEGGGKSSACFFAWLSVAGKLEILYGILITIQITIS